MSRADDLDREPTADERAGMDWWNGMSEPERGGWLRFANATSGGVSAADAWQCFKASIDLESLRVFQAAHRKFERGE